MLSYIKIYYKAKNPEWVTGKNWNLKIGDSYYFKNFYYKLNGIIYDGDTEEFRDAVRKEEMWLRLNER